MAPKAPRTKSNPNIKGLARPRRNPPLLPFTPPLSCLCSHCRNGFVHYPRRKFLGKGVRRGLIAVRGRSQERVDNSGNLNSYVSSQRNPDELFAFNSLHHSCDITISVLPLHLLPTPNFPSALTQIVNIYKCNWLRRGSFVVRLLTYSDLKYPGEDERLSSLPYRRRETQSIPAEGVKG